MFFRIHAFQGPGFLGSRFFRVQVFQGPGFFGSRFFWVQVFQGPGQGFKSSCFFYDCLNTWVSFKPLKRNFLFLQDYLDIQNHLK